MTVSRLLARGVVAPLALATLVACSDSTGSGAGPIAALAVSGVRMDETAFRNSGEFDLGLLATDASGRVIVRQNVTITAELTEVTGAEPAAAYGLVVQSHKTEPGNSSPTYAAILLDDSGSMSSNDPGRQRAAAAKLFWEAVLPARQTNRVAMLDFGAGSSAGFQSTRLLQTWTRDRDTLEAKLALVVSSGGTPLYRSMLETAQWMDSTTPSSANRVLLLLSDGFPGDNNLRETSITGTNAANVLVHTVGLGPASDLSNSPNAGAINTVRDIAERTGGVYAAATQAEALGPIFQTLARVATSGQILASMQVSPTPPPGSRVTGTVTVSSGGRTETATWSFRAP